MPERRDADASNRCILKRIAICAMTDGEILAVRTVAPWPGTVMCACSTPPVSQGST